MPTTFYTFLKLCTIVIYFNGYVYSSFFFQYLYFMVRNIVIIILLKLDYVY